MPLEILNVQHCYRPEIAGALEVVHRIGRELVGLGQRVRVLSLLRRRSRWCNFTTTVTCRRRREYEFEGIPVTQIAFDRETRRRMWPHVLRYYARRDLCERRVAALMLPAIAREAGRPDVIHVGRGGKAYHALAALAHARRIGAPFAITPFHHPRHDSDRYPGFDRAYREADAVFTLTDYEKEHLAAAKGVRPERMHVLGVAPVLSADYDAAAFRARHGIDGPCVLFLGRHEWYKGWAAVLRAAPLLWRRRPQTHFVFAGPQWRIPRAWLHLFGRDPRIHSLGAVDVRTKTSALAACDLLCVPSTQESFGIVYAEAWSLGKPVVGGTAPAVRSVIEEGRDGLIASHEAGEIAEKIAWLLDNPAEAAAMGERGRRKVEERYTWRRLAQKVLAVYRALV